MREKLKGIASYIFLSFITFLLYIYSLIYIVRNTNWCELLTK
jgi:hypothetical protein